jgi:hypothetical protein
MVPQTPTHPSQLPNRPPLTLGRRPVPSPLIQ